MRDGVRLATDIYFPASGGPSWPVLLERTPYGKSETNHADCTRAHPVPRSKPEMARMFAEAGFVCVVQDCRGRYGSEGSFTKYVGEGRDGEDTLAWLLAQPWCNGKVGTLGLSYGAHVQAAMAGLNPAGLAAMFLDSGGFSSAFHSGIRQGGAFELKQVTWALKHARLSPETTKNPSRKAALDSVDIRQSIRGGPWVRGQSPLCAAPEYEDYVLDLWARETFTDYWTQSGLYARGHSANFPDVPTVLMSSWYDPYAATAIENYCSLVGAKKGPIHLILGPWTHGQRSVTFAGDVDFGPAAPLDGNLAADYDSLRIGWFNHHLKGEGQGAPLIQPVSLFIMGGGSGRRTTQNRLDHGGSWLYANTWPLPNIVEKTMFLTSDNALAETVPTENVAVSWEHDPMNPVPTLGGALASGAPLMEAGAFNQVETEQLFGASIPGRSLSARPDVVSLQTEPLDADLTIVGPVRALLSVSSTAVDTDIMIKLIDVHPPNDDYPQGFAMNLTHGVLRLRFRNGFEKAELMEPGTIYPIEVCSFPTANVFKAGHRIRLDIAGSNFPHFDINDGTGAPAGSQANPTKATNAIHTGPLALSRLVLPVLPQSAC
jgi:uncharacterized protein